MAEGLSEIQIERLVYLAILGTLLVSFALVYRQVGIGRMLQQVILWVLIILGLAAAYGLWKDAMSGAAVTTLQQTTGEGLELRRGRDGHFHLTLTITGPSGGTPKPVRFIVDTGASDLVLSRADAAALGFGPGDLAFLGTARTANGTVRTAQVRLDRVRIGDTEQRNVRALVNEGELHVSLLGMAYLSRFSRIEMTRDRLLLEF